jgi:hypothetical protein
VLTALACVLVRVSCRRTSSIDACSLPSCPTHAPLTDALDMVGQYKWDAHKARAGMSTADAEQGYITLCRQLQAELTLKAAAGGTVAGGGGGGARNEYQGWGGGGGGGGASGGGGSAGGLEQVQSIMREVEGAAGKNDRDLAVLVAAEDYDELEKAVTTGAGVVDVNATNDDGETALHIACDRGFSRAIQFLLKHGADATVVSTDGSTPLHMLSVCGGEVAVSCAELLANAKVRVRKYAHPIWSQIVAAAPPRHTPLHTCPGASSHAYPHTTRTLTRACNAQADLNAQDEDGCTPLHHATANEEAALAQRLIDLKTDVSIQNADGNTAMDATIDWESGALLQLPAAAEE